MICGLFMGDLWIPFMDDLWMIYGFSMDDLRMICG